MSSDPASRPFIISLATDAAIAFFFLAYEQEYPVNCLFVSILYSDGACLYATIYIEKPIIRQMHSSHPL